jgi:hypothetical protein
MHCNHIWGIHDAFAMPRARKSRPIECGQSLNVPIENDLPSNWLVIHLQKLVLYLPYLLWLLNSAYIHPGQ